MEVEVMHMVCVKWQKRCEINKTGLFPQKYKYQPAAAKMILFFHDTDIGMSLVQYHSTMIVYWKE